MEWEDSVVKVTASTPENEDKALNLVAIVPVDTAVCRSSAVVFPVIQFVVY